MSLKTYLFFVCVYQVKKDNNKSMEQQKVIDNQDNNAGRAIGGLVSVVSAFVSFLVGGFSLYLSSLGTWWFIPLGVLFIIDGLFLFIPAFIKDGYKAMRVQGVIQIIGVLLLMPYLLFMILWNDPNGVMDYSYLTYLVFGSAAIFKLLIALFCRVAIKHNYHPFVHAVSNNGLIMVTYLVIIIELVIMNRFYPGTTTSPFDNLLREKPIWSYIVSILVNAAMTIFAALLALSTAIRAKTREELTTGGKIKHTIRWFNENEVSMFIGLMFTLYLAVLALINLKQSFFYILMFAYYMGIATIRVINYLWHKAIQKRCGDNQMKDNRWSSWILLFDAFAYLIFSNVLVVAAVFMMIQKANAGSNIYLFLFFSIPMAIMRFITTNKSIRANRRANNTYKLAVSLGGLVSVFFTLLEIAAIAFHGYSIVWLRFVLIILAIATAKIAVIIVAIIFVIHWFRSIILNNSIRERKLRKRAQDQQ